MKKKRLATVGCCLLLSVAALAGNYAKFYQGLPVAMNEPVAPVIPQNSVMLTDFGGVGDGVTMNTTAFAKAISALNKKGGGRLVVPAGVFLTGPVSLKDNIDLHLERNAMILFSPDKKDFLDIDAKTGEKKSSKARPGISASKRKNISITGEGIIDGNGEWWRGVKRSKVSDTEWSAYKEMGGMEAENGTLWYPFGLKHFDNIAATYKEQEQMRTHLIRLTDCENVLIEGVTIQNAPKFHLVPQRCRNVIIDGVNVRCMWNAQNGDGIDLMQCRDVLVVNSTLDVGDDGICLKGGVGAEGVKHGPCANILIENNVVFHAHGGFVIGSEFSGGMNNIVVRHNTFSGTDTGLRFKSGAGRGGKTSGIFISDIMMSDIRNEAVVFETSYADRPVGSSEKTEKPKAEDFIPEFCDIHIERVVCRDARTAIAAKGTKEMIHDIELTDCVFFYTKKDKAVDDDSMLKLNNVRLLTFK